MGFDLIVKGVKVTVADGYIRTTENAKLVRKGARWIISADANSSNTGCNVFTFKNGSVQVSDGGIVGNVSCNGRFAMSMRGDVSVSADGDSVYANGVEVIRDGQPVKRRREAVGEPVNHKLVEGDVFDSISSEGRGKIDFKDESRSNKTKFNLHVTGPGKIKLDTTGKEAKLSVTGSGKIQGKSTFDFIGAHVIGSGSIKDVIASKKFKATITGSGKIKGGAPPEADVIKGGTNKKNIKIKSLY